MSDERLDRIREISSIKDIQYSHTQKAFQEYSIDRALLRILLGKYDELAAQADMLAEALKEECSCEKHEGVTFECDACAVVEIYNNWKPGK